MMEDRARKLVTEDGEVFSGWGFGSGEDRICELVFNTAAVGYQEILSDPSYTDQAVVMTYPLIGNYGMALEDYETERPTIGALAVREYNDHPSSFRSEESLDSVMKRFGIPGIRGVDTRRLTRSIRDRGSRRALLTDGETPREECLRRLREAPVPTDAVSRVSPRAPAVFPAPQARFTVAAFDCGMKRNIVRELNARGCTVVALPWDSSPELVERLSPQGIFLSNGPGDPADLPGTVAAVRALRGKYPVFGVCLGHQILSLAYGARTYKLKFGHHGANHPVRDLSCGRIEITSQNHNFAVDERSLAGTGLAVTHLNLLDGTVEGVACPRDRAFSVQFHPESAPGPRDSAALFDRFLRMMEEAGSHA